MVYYVALTLVEKSINLKIVISGTLPRDYINNIRRFKIKEVNQILKNEMPQFKIKYPIHLSRFRLGHQCTKYDLILQRPLLFNKKGT